ncbi:hypothetical protein EYF80_026296 [Liparis tanakae]|uniref:Uncharacterized protein n=1 Tax=Liparis tanakae TaxID=230148 RepID=A0A4Z2HCH6_9TELE|nr:hypothetical protein EYF80_026296 [Liparis tanakae]
MEWRGKEKQHTYMTPISRWPCEKYNVVEFLSVGQRQPSSHTRTPKEFGADGSLVIRRRVNGGLIVGEPCTRQR